MTAALRLDVAPAVADARAERASYPPRVAPATWPQTEQSREVTFDRLLAPPFQSPSMEVRGCARRCLTVLLDWLAAQPGDTWQSRWLVSGADNAGRDWIDLPARHMARPVGQLNAHTRTDLITGARLLIVGQVIRPGYPWLLRYRPSVLLEEARRLLDPAGFARLRAPGLRVWRLPRHQPRRRDHAAGHGHAVAAGGQGRPATADDRPPLRHRVLVQAGWVARLALDQPAYLYVGLGLSVAELLVPIWAERAQVTTWHLQHITERYGLFTMIVLGEAVLAATIAVQTAADERHRMDVDLLVLAGSGLLLVFSLWWLYFDRTAQRMLRSLGTTIIWGYGHYFIFASTAAIGAGLSVAVDALGGHAHVTHLQQGLAVGVPLAVWIVAVWWLHVGPLLRGPVVAASPLAAVLVLAAAWTPAAVPVMAGITAALAVVTTWAMRRADWPIPAHQTRTTAHSGAAKTQSPTRT